MVTVSQTIPPQATPGQHLLRFSEFSISHDTTDNVDKLIPEIDVLHEQGVVRISPIISLDTNRTVVTHRYFRFVHALQGDVQNDPQAEMDKLKGRDFQAFTGKKHNGWAELDFTKLSPVPIP